MKLVPIGITAGCVAIASGTILLSLPNPTRWIILGMTITAGALGAVLRHVAELEHKRNLCVPGTIGNTRDIPENIPFFAMAIVYDDKTEPLFPTHVVVAQNLRTLASPQAYFLDDAPPTYFRRIGDEIVPTTGMMA